MSAAYWELAVPAPLEVAEALTNFLWDLGALGVVEEQVAGGAPMLRAFFPAQSEAALLADRVRTYADGLRALGFRAPDAPTVTPLADTDWGEAWKAHFRPLPVGKRWLVVPPWESAAHEPGRLTLVIEPARAFGTGHHGTTAGCLVQLEKIVEGNVPTSVIDLGTGSGILAIAAARAGVAHVLAVDEDPDAVAAARANAARNGVADRVTGRIVDAAVVSEPSPLVLANLLSAAHLRLAPAYARHVMPDGHLVVGGVLDAEAASVEATLHGHGFVDVDTTSIEGWTTLHVRRAGLEPPPAG